MAASIVQMYAFASGEVGLAVHTGAITVRSNWALWQTTASRNGGECAQALQYDR